MTQLRTLLIGTALTAMASTAAFAQTAAQPSADLSTQAQVQQAPAAAPAAPALMSHLRVLPPNGTPVHALEDTGDRSAASSGRFLAERGP